MKAEKRKELQKNDLAAGIEKFIAGVTEGPSKNTMTYAILVVVVIALVVTMIWTWKYFSNQSQVADADRWEELNRINSLNAWSVNAAELERFADDKNNADTPQRRQARFELARYYSQFDRDLANPFPDRRAEALGNVKKGRDLYKDLIKDAGNVPAQAQEALMGAAKGSEAVGDVSEARGYYEKLQKEHPQSVYGKDAAKQLERLNNNAKDLEELNKLLAPKGP
jgi:hypothetical protein